VDKGLFRLYAVRSIEDCFEILCEDMFRTRGKRKIIDIIRENIVNKLERYKNIFNDKNKK
ncbi:MAG: hypothetical protein K0R09_291, partial [Clostridiales bacterium]|nr:hypothetical protein [Clostridiales bacterium]